MAAEDRSNEGKKLSPLHMFKQHYISRTLILILGWTCTCVGYYSLALNSTKISGDIFLNFYLATLVDALTCLVFMVTLDRLGRKWNLVFALALLGICCIIL